MIAWVVALASAAQQGPGDRCAGPPPGMMGPPPGMGPGMAMATPADGGIGEGYDTGAYDAALRAQGISDAGIAALQRARAPHDDPAAARAATLAADRAVVAAAAAIPLDLATLDRALRERDSLVARQRAAQTQRLVRALGALPPADRPVLLKLVGTGIGAGSRGPGPGGPPPGFGGPPPGCGGPPPAR